jgi:putative ABC transport system substrate-binding protein
MHHAAMLNRRRFLQAVSVSLLALPLVAEAQHAGKVWRIGFLYEGQKINAAGFLQPFLEGLRQLGYVEGKTLSIEVWATEGHRENIRALAAQLVRAKPDVIVVHNAGQAAIAQELTKTLPIVALSAGELVYSGMAATLAKPGGNLTGMQLYSPELMGKRLQILQEVVPNLRRLAVLRTPIRWTPQFFARYRQATDEPAAKLGISARYVGFDSPDQLPGLFAEMAKERDDALLVWGNPNIRVFFERIQELTIRHRLPAMHELSLYVRQGGLMAYGPKLDDVLRQAATHVDRIFKGANPGDLPIGQPTTFELVVNLRTAKALGLTIPPSLLLRADQVIE